MWMRVGVGVCACVPEHFYFEVSTCFWLFSHVAPLTTAATTTTIMDTCRFPVFSHCKRKKKKTLAHIHTHTQIAIRRNHSQSHTPTQIYKHSNTHTQWRPKCQFGLVGNILIHSTHTHIYINHKWRTPFSPQFFVCVCVFCC